MDPNTARMSMLTHARAIRRAAHDDQGVNDLAQALAQGIEDFDEWLVRGGFPPAAWGALRDTQGAHVMHLSPAHKMDENDPRSFARAVCSCGDYTSSVDSPNGATRAWVEHWRARTNGIVAAPNAPTKACGRGNDHKAHTWVPLQQPGPFWCPGARSVGK